ncbi:MAG TPA: CBS domain-containing protein, partial [Allocoleopsis sp.]
MCIHLTGFTQVERTSAIIRHPLVVTPDTMVIDAIAQMSSVRALCMTGAASSQFADNPSEIQTEARSSCVFVLENNQLIGIFTERDVVRLIAQKRTLASLRIREVMTHPVITLRESLFTDLFFAINLLQQHRIRHLPLLDESDRLVGLLTHESLRQISRPGDLLRLRLVAEVMTTQVICTDPGVFMLDIARLMAKHRVSSVVLVQARSIGSETLQIPMGIVTERDLVQFQALNLNWETCQA